MLSFLLASKSWEIKKALPRAFWHEDVLICTLKFEEYSYSYRTETTFLN